MVRIRLANSLSSDCKHSLRSFVASKTFRLSFWREAIKISILYTMFKIKRPLDGYSHVIVVQLICQFYFTSSSPTPLSPSTTLSHRRLISRPLHLWHPSYPLLFMKREYTDNSKQAETCLTNSCMTSDQQELVMQTKYTLMPFIEIYVNTVSARPEFE